MTVIKYLLTYTTMNITTDLRERDMKLEAKKLLRNRSTENVLIIDINYNIYQITYEGFFLLLSARIVE